MKQHLLVACAVVVSILGLAAIFQATITPDAISTDSIVPASVVQYCGFSGLPQPRPETITGPNGDVLPIEVWETWSLAPNEDDDPSDGLDSGECELYFEVIIADGRSENLVLNIHEVGPLGITASRGNDTFDDFATDDLLVEMNLKWIRDLRLRDRAFVKLFWITATRETVVHRRMVSVRELHFIIRDVADSYGIGDSFTNLDTPEELKDLPGTNSARTREQCWRESGEPFWGKLTFTCERVVDVFVDDPATPDIINGTVNLTVHPDRLSATMYAGAFAIYEPSPDPMAVVERYGLADLVKQYCQETKRVTFRVNIYTGEVSDEQMITCSQL